MPRHHRRAPRSRRPSTAPAILAIVVAGAAAYATSFHGVLVFDDEPSIVENRHVRRVWPIREAMAAPPDTTLAGRPVASLTFALTHALAPAGVRDALVAPAPGANPDAVRRFLDRVWWDHAVNLVIHLLAALTLYGVVRCTLVSDPLRERFGAAANGLALAIAAIWIVHPLLTGSVTYIVQRVESLMGLFYLLTIYGAIRALDSPRRAWWNAASVTACALGMGSKEVMVSAPLMVMAWDAFFAPEAGRATTGLEPGATGRGSKAPVAESPARSPITVAQGFSAAGRRALYCFLAATWLALAVLVSRGARTSSVGFGFAAWPWTTYLLTQAGVVVHYLRLAFVPSPLVLDYEWPAARSIVEVLPQAALLLALIAATAWAAIHRKPFGFAGLWFFAILAPTSSVLPIVTEIAGEHRMYLPLAAVIAVAVLTSYRWWGRRAPVAAIGATAAIVVSFGAMTSARNRDYHDHADIWADTVRKRPGNTRARNNYASVLIARGRFGEAEEHLRAALAKNPGFAEAHANLGVALCARDACEEGVTHLERAIAIAPGYATAHKNLGEAYASLGRFAPAVEQYLEALERQPDDVMALNRAGWILATANDRDVRNGPRALDLAERAVRLTGRQDVVSLDTLAAALAEAGRRDAAALVAGEALALARAKGEQAIVPELESRVEQYRRRR